MTETGWAVAVTVAGVVGIFLGIVAPHMISNDNISLSVLLGIAATLCVPVAATMWTRRRSTTEIDSQ